MEAGPGGLPGEQLQGLCHVHGGGPQGIQVLQQHCQQLQASLQKGNPKISRFVNYGTIKNPGQFAFSLFPPPESAFKVNDDIPLSVNVQLTDVS
jgi:hypothetical protein